MRSTKLFKKDIVRYSVLGLCVGHSVLQAPLFYALNIPVNTLTVIIDILASLCFFFEGLYELKEKKRKTSRFYYLLAINILVSLPIEFFIYAFALPQPCILIKMARLLKLKNILRIFSVVGTVTVIPNSIKVPLGSVSAFIALNWIAAGWMLLYPKEQAENLTSYYIKSIYWAVTTLTTIGYGDITPTTDGGRIYTICIMILGVGVYGVVIGNFSRMLVQADRYREQAREKIHDLTVFMRHYQVPPKLQKTIFNYYNHLLSKRLSDNDSQIIKDLPAALQTEIQTYMIIRLIRGFAAFKKCSQECLKAVAKSLEQIHFSPGQKVIKEGEIGNEMFILAHGTVEVMINKSIVAKLGDGQFFGEAALLEERERNANVVTTSYCDLYRLSKEDFLKIIKSYPELLESMESFIKKRK